MAGRAIPGGALPQGRRLGRAGRGLLRRGRPAGERVHGVRVPGPDLAAAAGVPDPDRGAGADVRAALRDGARPARGRRDPGRSVTVKLAAGAAGPAGRVVPLSPSVPRHAADGAETPGARPGPGPAPPRRRLV